jgi:hypothetical protein
VVAHFPDNRKQILHTDVIASLSTDTERLREKTAFLGYSTKHAFNLSMTSTNVAGNLTDRNQTRRRLYQIRIMIRAIGGFSFCDQKKQEKDSTGSPDSSTHQ